MQLIYTLIFCLLTSMAQGQETRNPSTKPPVEHVPAPVVKDEPHFPEEFETMKSEPDNFLSQLWSMAVTVGVLVGLIMLMTWVLKRMVNNRTEQVNSKSDIKILETRNISPKSAIHVIEVYGKNYVLAESINGVTALGETRSPLKSDFEKILQNKDLNS